MNLRKPLFFILLALVPLALPGAAQGETAKVVPGEVVVRFAASAEPAQRQATLAAFAPAGSEPTGVAGARVLQLAEGESVDTAVRRLERRPDVAWAEPNYVLHLMRTPNDPRFGFQWGLQNLGQSGLPDERAEPQYGVSGIDIGAAAAWDLATGGGVEVGIVDSGISPTHPDLLANLDAARSRNFVPAASFDPDPPIEPAAWADVHGHGTHVGGIVGAVANNGLGVAGVNWSTRLISARACSASGECPTVDVAAAFAYLGAAGVPVVNASLGGDGDTDEEIQLMRAAMAAHPNTLYVIAAGNGDELGVGFDVDQQPVYPCASALPNVLCVAAIDARGELAGFSNWGARTVDLAAPGVFVESTFVQRLEPFFDFFENGIGGWEQAPYEWEEGEIDGDPTLRFRAEDGGVPSPVAEASATLAEPFDLSGGSACWLRFGLGAELSGAQTFAVEAGAGGDPFEPLPPTVYDASSAAAEPTEVTASLEEFNGAEEVRLRFRFLANGDEEPAPSIDVGAVDVSCIDQQPAGGAYRAISGTSMATPMVAGVAALARSVAPNLSGAALRQALLAGTVPLPSLAGRTVSGGMISAARVLAHLRPAPVPVPILAPARLGALRLNPARPAAPVGRARTLTARVRNLGELPARRLRVCLRAPRALVAGTRCTQPRRLAPGRWATVRFRVRPTARARPGSSPALRVRATAAGVEPRKATVRLRVRRR